LPIIFSTQVFVRIFLQLQWADFACYKTNNKLRHKGRYKTCCIYLCFFLFTSSLRQLINPVFKPKCLRHGSCDSFPAWHIITKVSRLGFLKLFFRGGQASSQRLLQYFQLPDKNSRYISRYIYNFCSISKQLCIYSTLSVRLSVCLSLSRNPWRCSVEP
jgi:hypothetical protein